MENNTVVKLTELEFNKLNKARIEGKPVELWTEDNKQYGLLIESMKEIEPEKTPLYSKDVQKLATSLHEQFCGYNHTDGCGWFYEESQGRDPWNGHATAHNSWAEKAKKIMKDNNF